MNFTLQLPLAVDRAAPASKPTHKHATTTPKNLRVFMSRSMAMPKTIALANHATIRCRTL